MLEELITLGLVTLSQAMPPSNNEGGYYTLINKTPHRHKAYFKSDFGVFRCGCGMLVDC